MVLYGKRNPKAQVLLSDTGYSRNYSVGPYEGYYRVGKIWFPVGRVRKDMKPKERILGIEIGDKARAYSLSVLQRQQNSIKDEMNGGFL